MKNLDIRLETCETENNQEWLMIKNIVLQQTEPEQWT
jgi:hypothetical protein